MASVQTVKTGLVASLFVRTAFDSRTTLGIRPTAQARSLAMAHFLCTIVQASNAHSIASPESRRCPPRCCLPCQRNLDCREGQNRRESRHPRKHSVALLCLVTCAASKRRSPPLLCSGSYLAVAATSPRFPSLLRTLPSRMARPSASCFVPKRTPSCFFPASAPRDAFRFFFSVLLRFDTHETTPCSAVRGARRRALDGETRRSAHDRTIELRHTFFGSVPDSNPIERKHPSD